VSVAELLQQPPQHARIAQRPMALFAAEVEAFDDRAARMGPGRIEKRLSRTVQRLALNASPARANWRREA
jgi:hypothetical protein